MKVVLPENISEITLGQYQEYSEIANNEDDFNHKVKVISIFCKVPENVVDQFPIKQIEEFYNQILKALSQEVNFTQRFEFDGVEFGFIPNLDEIKVNEFRDLTAYQNDIENYHRLMAVLFRPITNKDKFGNYSIAEYNGTSKWADKMKELPLNFVNGALFFFSSLSKELEISTHKYIQKAQQKERKHQTILKGGGGMQPSSV